MKMVSFPLLTMPVPVTGTSPLVPTLFDATDSGPIRTISPGAR